MSDEAVGQVLDVVDLVADEYDVDRDGLLLEAWSRVRKQNGGRPAN